MSEEKKKERTDPIVVKVRASGAPPGSRIVTIEWPDKTQVEVTAGSDGDKKFIACDRLVDVGPGMEIPAGARIFVPPAPRQTG